MSAKQRKTLFPNKSQAAQGITAEHFQIVAMIKVDYPSMVTIPDRPVVMVWASFHDVRAYFGWIDNYKVVAKLLATGQVKRVLHYRGVQLRYTLDGTTPTRDFNNPQNYRWQNLTVVKR